MTNRTLICANCLGSVRTIDGSPAPTHEEVEASSCWSVCRHSEQYPRRLLHLADPPDVIFGLGRRDLLAGLDGEVTGVTIVGSRRASRAGLEAAESISRDLSNSGIVVISGMALGIDSAAHRGALAGSAPTVAVLGCGPDFCYPRRLEPIYRQILERGSIISELPPGSEPRPWTFPARNRIMAALGGMTLVVEAKRKSGSLITAAMAADIGREIGAMPAPVAALSGEGANALLRDGAAVIRHADDVVDSLLGPGRDSVRQLATGPGLAPDLLDVLETVERVSGTVDEIALFDSADPDAVAVALARLEILGYIERGRGGRFERTNLATPRMAL